MAKQPKGNKVYYITKDTYVTNIDNNIQYQERERERHPKKKEKRI